MQNDSISIRKDLIIGVLLGVVILLVGYIFLRGFFSSNNQSPSSVTEELETGLEDEFITPNQDFTIESLGTSVKRFSWAEKDLFFNYSPFFYLETEDFIGPDESNPIPDPVVDLNGNIIFSNGYLEIFDRVPSDTIERSIRVKFFNGETDPGCQIRRVYPTDEDFIYQPIPGMIFARMKGLTCPEKYRSDANFSRAFLVLDNIPEKLFFVDTIDGESVSLRTISGAPFFNGIDKISNTTITN